MNAARPDQALPDLTPEEQAIYEWQLDVGGFGLAGQRRLKAATVFVSRAGGLGGNVALHLAAAGVGRLILAHAGDIRPSDLNRQLLMAHDRIGTPRLATAAESLRRINPRLDLVTIPENISPANAARCVGPADVIVDCAPLFAERFALNHAAIKAKIPMVEAAVFDLDFHLTTLLPGQTPCLRCLYPEANVHWTRKFPVISPVPGVAGSLAALEVIKLLTGLGPTLAGKLLVADLRQLQFRTLPIRRLPSCPECGGI
ncbi:MAG: HesA/MoeB/ThiF family protein [Verrucomicrobiales bacterium]|nr:HesA/MoeB/ThiF family protein [Verrucomicrobiales bacterium]